MLSSCSAKASGNGQSIQGMPLDRLALVTKDTGVPELHRKVTTGETVLGRPPLPRALRRQQTKTQTQMSYEKSLFI